MEKIGSIEFNSKAAEIRFAVEFDELPLASRKRLAQAATRAFNDYVNAEVKRQCDDDKALIPRDVAKTAANAWKARLMSGDWTVRAGAAMLSPFETQRRLIVVDQLVKGGMTKAEAEKSAKDFESATRAIGEAIAKATDRGDVETVVVKVREAINAKAEAAVKLTEEPLF